MNHGVMTLDEAVASGISRRKVFRLVEQGEWQRLHAGVYLTRRATEPTSEAERLAGWKATLAGMLQFGGPGAMVSRRSAARLHRLEGIDGFPIDVIIPSGAVHRPPGAHRSRIPDPRAFRIDGLLPTSLARTLRDLATVCGADVVEQAVESALRGPDRSRPDIWNTHLLVELRELVNDGARLPGVFALRTVLSRRSDTDRPTGSLPETLLFQALRSLGINAARQATLRIVDRHGFRLDVFFPDLCVPECRLLIEVDGSEGHSGGPALARDLRRQNKLVKAFRILRFTAAEVLSDPAGVAEQIRRSTTHMPRSGPAWRVEDVSVSYSPNNFEVVDHSRDAKEEATRRSRAS